MNTSHRYPMCQGGGEKIFFFSRNNMITFLNVDRVHRPHELGSKEDKEKSFAVRSLIENRRNGLGKKPQSVVNWFVR